MHIRPRSAAGVAVRAGRAAEARGGAPRLRAAAGADPAREGAPRRGSAGAVACWPELSPVRWVQAFGTSFESVPLNTLLI